MAGVTLHEYRELVVRSGLLSPDDVLAQFNEFQPANDSSPDAGRNDLSESGKDAAAHFARHLETNGLLTEWQNANLLRGRFRGLMFGKFRILKLLGAGGMGRVFLAENQLLRRQVALKILPKKFSSHPTALERFHQEARALARLNHNNIVRVHDVDVHENTHYIVMEYVQGIDLHRRVAKHGPLDETTAARYIHQAAQGLSHAHQAGLIHRDVKPANMLIDADGQIKVLDLGLALLQTDEDGSITADPSQALGTADYISPEQALNSRQLDARSDIYSLGCSLYFLLTGIAPFATGTNAERLLAHQLKSPTPINDIRQQAGLAAVGEPIIQVCSRMMSKKPQDRFATAADIAEHLAPLAGQIEDRDAAAIDGSLTDDDSQSTLDTQSLQQLQTISEAAASSSRGTTSRSLVTSKSSTKQPARTAIVIAAAVTAIAIAGGTFAAMQSSSSETGLESEVITAASPSPPKNSASQSFYVVGDNHIYHTGDCRHIQGRSNVNEVSESILQSGILRPCRTCKPESP